MHSVLAAGVLVLDEADQLLAPQFAADVSRIALHCGKRLPAGLQTIVVSATLSPQVCPGAFITEQHTHLADAKLCWHATVHAPATLLTLPVDRSQRPLHSSQAGRTCFHRSQ